VKGGAHRQKKRENGRVGRRSQKKKKTLRSKGGNTGLSAPPPAMKEKATRGHQGIFKEIPIRNLSRLYTLPD